MDCQHVHFNSRNYKYPVRSHKCIFCGVFRSDWPDRRFHSFPKNPQLSDKWAAIAKKKRVTIASPEERHSRFHICSIHFEDNDYSSPQKFRLRRNAVPKPCSNSSDIDSKENHIQVKQEPMKVDSITDLCTSTGDFLNCYVRDELKLVEAEGFLDGLVTDSHDNHLQVKHEPEETNVTDFYPSHSNSSRSYIKDINKAIKSVRDFHFKNSKLNSNMDSQPSHSNLQKRKSFLSCLFCGALPKEWPDRKFHGFPQNHELSNKWAAISKKKLIIKTSPNKRISRFRVCSSHFKNSDYFSASKARLRPNAIPTLNMPNSSVNLELLRMKQNENLQNMPMIPENNEPVKNSLTSIINSKNICVKSVPERKGPENVGADSEISHVQDEPKLKQIENVISNDSCNVNADSKVSLIQDETKLVQTENTLANVYSTQSMKLLYCLSGS